MSDPGDTYRSAQIARFQQLFDHSFKLQAEYGRWLISSLLFLHSAAIAGLLFKTDAKSIPYLTSLWWFIFGIVFALGAGLAAWWNFTFACHVYYQRVDQLLRNQPQASPIPTDKVTATLWLSSACGVLSVLCLLAGAGAVWCSWPRIPSP